MNAKDSKYLAENDHIPTAEVWQDIKDTNDEIREFKQKRAALTGDQSRQAHMKRRHYSVEIKCREEFTNDLRRLLKLRGEIK